MTIAKWLRPRTVLRQLTLVVGAGLLGGCQSTASEAPATAPVAVATGWQVVERLGDARWRDAADGAWAPAMPHSALPAGSQVVTGRGGRLIAARQGTHLSAGPGSRFSLPEGAPTAPLEQHAGQLRYRIGEAAPQRLVVATRFLEIAPDAAVFDVAVTPAATEVAVVQGRVRIATPDGLRHIELATGQSAYAGAGDGKELGFRRAPGVALERVAPIILPAMQPRASTSEGRVAATARVADSASSQASTSGAAASEAVVTVARAEVAAAAASRRATAVAAAPEPARRAPPAEPEESVAAPARPAGRSAPDDAGATRPLAAQGPAGPRPPTDPALPAPGPAAERPGDAPLAELPSSFDRLTAGMVAPEAGGPRAAGANASAFRP